MLIIVYTIYNQTNKGTESLKTQRKKDEMDENFEKLQDAKWNALKSIVERPEDNMKLSWDDEDVKFLCANTRSFAVEDDLTALIEGKKQDDEDEREIAIANLIADSIYDIRGALLDYYIENGDDKGTDYRENPDAVVKFNTETEYLVNIVINMGF